jgi:CRISPR-associated protein Cmr4
MSDHVGALLGLHAQTSMHAGTGTALGTVDLPVQRERHTGWPMVAGSALKGILRDACREKLRTKAEHGGSREKANADVALTAAFGPPTAEADKHAGALSVTDARLLAFPVRSLKGVFAWVTCPAALDRLARDAALAGVGGMPWDSKTKPDPTRVMAVEACPCLVEETAADGKKVKRVVLEEFDFTPLANPMDGKLAGWLVTNLLPEGPHYNATRDGFAKRLLVLHDDDFTHFARHATEVTARIGLDYESKTVKDGALFYQEFLPPETVMYAVVLANPSRAKGTTKAAGELLGWVEGVVKDLPFLQVGGDETTGKGLCGVRLTEGGGQ